MLSLSGGNGHHDRSRVHQGEPERHSGHLPHNSKWRNPRRNRQASDHPQRVRVTVSPRFRLDHAGRHNSKHGRSAGRYPEALSREETSCAAHAVHHAILPIGFHRAASSSLCGGAVHHFDGGILARTAATNAGQYPHAHGSTVGAAWGGVERRLARHQLDGQRRGVHPVRRDVGPVHRSALWAPRSQRPDGGHPVPHDAEPVLRAALPRAAGHRGQDRVQHAGHPRRAGVGQLSADAGPVPEGLGQADRLQEHPHELPGHVRRLVHQRSGRHERAHVHQQGAERFRQCPYK
uniref:(northern house mosquito) hypothetical protein n=2 Tax=Culex pipiens TaxID=7175 RepID=A0A8D8IIJ7_CULPI